MKLLIVAATEAEVKPLSDRLPALHDMGKDIHLLITGVGMTETTYSLTKHLQQYKYDLVLQAGVGGSYDQSMPLGTVVVIESDRYGDLGAEDHDRFLDIFDMGLIPADTDPYNNGIIKNNFLGILQRTVQLPRATGLTVNTVSGNAATIERRTAQYGAAVESMEGAAFHFVCRREDVPFVQIRAISNYVTPRDKSQWQMKEAIINLNNWLIEFCSNF